MRRLAVTLLVLALLGGTTAAFAVTEALKLERSPVTAPRFDKRFSPTCGCETGKARLALRLREADTIDAVIVDAEGEPVRTLASNAERPKGVVAFDWDGRDDAGRVVRDGRYRLRIHLDGQRRTIVIPNTVQVDTKPPKVELVRVHRRVFSPDGDGRNDRVKIVYLASESVRPVVLVDGAVAVRGKGRAAGKAKLGWGGKVGGRPLPAGVYDLALFVRDRAGNRSEPTAPVSVRIRYIELAKNVLRARRGGELRFRVVTDASPFRWSLFRLRGPSRPLLAGDAERNVVVVRLPSSLKPGRYVLDVVANGRRDAALVYLLRARR